jgi:hypothetical protein
MYGLLGRGHESERVAGDANVKYHARIIALENWEIDERSRFFSDCVVVCGPRDADDRSPSAIYQDPPPNGILLRPIFVREFLVHDGDWL